MKSDIQIQEDVMEQLKWEPFLKSSEIGVTVKDGIVTLSGQVDSYAKKLSAENAARKIAGVRAIAEDIEISVYPSHIRTDSEIAASVLDALHGHMMIPEGVIKVKVENGVVRLDGEVEWEYQKVQAKYAIQNLPGIRYVLNFVKVKPKVSTTEIRKKINAAFHRSALIDSGRINIELVGDKVILRGKVRSFAEKEDAENAAWNAPGVSNVESQLEIEVGELVL
ncbi:MAG: BON domain-containing protein [Bacteroidota bacterium]|nr:BON domain-containing protein [Bacteroidota bacterium]